MAKPEKPQEKRGNPDARMKTAEEFIEEQREAMLEENAPQELANKTSEHALVLDALRDPSASDGLKFLGELSRPGESMGQTLARVLADYDSMRALLVGPNVVARGLLVKYEGGPGYDKGGQYSVHRVTVDNGSVDVAVCRGMGRVVDGVLKEVHVGAWHHAQEEFSSAAERFVKPAELR